MVAFLGRLLSQRGHEASTPSTTAQTALAHIAASPPDLVLLDVHDARA